LGFVLFFFFFLSLLFFFLGFLTLKTLLQKCQIGILEKNNNNKNSGFLNLKKFLQKC
jgi:hypothetical protein